MKTRIMQYKVTLIRLGHVQHLVDFNSIIKWKSQLFTISGIDCIEHLPDSDVEDGFLDVKYTKSRLKTLISCPANSDYAVAVMPYRFEDNFYMHRVNDKCVVISLCGISDILKSDNISIEHFIIKQLYEICAIRHIISDLSSDDVYQFIHPDTRGCLFDLNGKRSDILYNTEQPIICEECKGKFKSKQIQAETIHLFEHELKRIRKPFALRMERWIKRYPLLSIFISALTAIALNILANFIGECLSE